MWLLKSFCFALFVLSQNSLGLMEEKFDFTNLIGFPEDFIFSTATASYQVEGAWNTSGKGENIWDRLTHTRKNLIKDGRSGDIACDSYHKYKEDIQNIKAIGFKMYRFSLSWSRLFPTGYTTTVNSDGVRYYTELIDELLANGIQPMVTIYHWDLPQPLEDIGGWLNPKIADIFGEYARAVFKLFGVKVKWWGTINEPESVTAGYGGVIKAPALNLHGTGEYLSAHNMLRAHAKAYRIYDKEFRKSQKGRLSIILNGSFFTPKNSSDPSHVEAAERRNQFYNGWFADPIYKGDYPAVMRAYIDRNSKAEGRCQSRLPSFTKEEIEEIKGSHDFMALNHYTTHSVEPGRQGLSPSIAEDTNTIISEIPNANPSFCDWLWVTPTQFRQYVNWMRKKYGDYEIFITENGYCDSDNLNDYNRINYYSEYLRNLLAAIKEDGIKIIGHTTWSLMDNYEWLDGYSSKFGLIRVDFDSPERTRTWKKSAVFMKELIGRNTHCKLSLFLVK